MSESKEAIKGATAFEATVFERATPEQLAASKKQALKNRKDFELHVGMVMHMDGESNVSAARAVAYLEGPSGLDRRLGVPKLV